MQTYMIEVRGKKILSQISQKELQEKLKLIRGLVWTSGGDDKDITVILNKV